MVSPPVTGHQVHAKAMDTIAHHQQRIVPTAPCESHHRRRRTQTDTIDRRAERAESLVHLGELSSGRHALEGAPLAPGNEETRRALTDKEAQLSENLLSFQPGLHEPTSVVEEEVCQTWSGWRAFRDDSRTLATSS